MSRKHALCYEFGPFRIDVAERLLLRDGRVIAMTPKVFETLLLLVENSGHAMEKEELMQSLWPDSFVEEGSLAQNVARLRKLLGDGGKDQNYIQTLPKRGYRFVAEVKRLEGEEFELVVRRRTKAHIITTDSVETDALQAATAASLPATTSAIRTIAVLPFSILSAEESYNYLGLGLADALITQFSNTGQIVVRPTSAVRKYAEERGDSVAAGRELKVDAVLEGSIQQAGNRLRVTVQMVSVRDGVDLWGEKFNTEFTDIFTVQDTISEQVAHSLTMKLSGEGRERLTKRYTENVEAYRAYLKGRYFWNNRWKKSKAAEFEKAIKCFEQAIEIDPTYALAYAGLADCYTLMPSYVGLQPKDYVERARAAALKALELDSQLAEPHAALGFLKRVYDWDLKGSGEYLQRAIELNPNYALARHWYSSFLWCSRRFDEAIAAIEEAHRLDPASLLVGLGVGITYYVARRYDRAIEKHLSLLELDPNFHSAHYHLGLAYGQKGMYAEAIAEIKLAQELAGETPFMLASLGATYAMAGMREEALRSLAELQEISARRYVMPLNFATIYAGLDEKEKALAELERSYEDHDVNLSTLHVDPQFDNLHSDPRFQDLMRRVGLTL